MKLGKFVQWKVLLGIVVVLGITPICILHLSHTAQGIIQPVSV